MRKGLLGAGAYIVTGVGKGVAVINTLIDQDYAAAREAKMRRAPPKHVGVGVKRGVQSLATGVWSGVTGQITLQPNFSIIFFNHLSHSFLQFQLGNQQPIQITMQFTLINYRNCEESGERCQTSRHDWIRERRANWIGRCVTESKLG